MAFASGDSVCAGTSTTPTMPQPPVGLLPEAQHKPAVCAWLGWAWVKTGRRQIAFGNVQEGRPGTIGATGGVIYTHS